MFVEVDKVQIETDREKMRKRERKLERERQKERQKERSLNTNLAIKAQNDFVEVGSLILK